MSKLGCEGKGKDKDRGVEGEASKELCGAFLSYDAETGASITHASIQQAEE